MDARFGLLIVIALIIHPICVIDEYAIIDRSCVWFSPIAPPIMAFRVAIAGIIGLFVLIFVI